VGPVKVWLQLGLERLEIPYVRVIKQDGSVVTAGADAVQELNESIQRNAPVYTDYREKHVTVPGLRPGDVLEYETVVVIHTALAPGQFWTQYHFQKNAIVFEEQLEIDIPAARTVKLSPPSNSVPQYSRLSNPAPIALQIRCARSTGYFPETGLR
jgi:Domain of Unknown Function with PDB structure (DUF3857)